jgi:hypothetical protein
VSDDLFWQDLSPCREGTHAEYPERGRTHLCEDPCKLISCEPRSRVTLMVVRMRPSRPVIWASGRGTTT